MKQRIAWIGAGVLLWGIIAGLAGCASSPPLPPSPPEFTYEEEAIELYIKADPRLNLYDGLPHTLLLCVYQLRDPNSFHQLADQPGGIYKLLECAPFDASVAAAKRLIVHPDQDLKYPLDRAEGARYVAVVAGYYALQKGNIIRLFDVPVVVEKPEAKGRQPVSRPAHLTVELDLGSERIEDRPANDAPPKTP
ncbi:Type VI secretion system outer membrane lipoprotein TssJ [uncultured Desulfatiglans sp.]|nr:Type VI secretion system outer membrane lipoprotein TssJ [uncultured Desulfatiglans sp.]